MPGFGLKAEDGTIAFFAFDHDPEWRRRPRPEGRYTSIAHIPGNLLTEGLHFVDCQIFRAKPDKI